jgi:hypothetical protein
MVNFMCVLSALLFMAGNALLITYYVREYNRPHFDYDTYVSLDPAYIQEEWEFRIEHRPKYLAAGLLNAFAWFFFMFPMVQLSWILSQGGAKWISLHLAIGLLALAGSFTEWISRFLYIGTTMATELLATQFNLDAWITTDDQIGWRSLEVTHVVTYGLVSFIDAFEWIILFIIFTLVHISVKRWRRQVDSTTFGACWNALGLFVALFCLLDFIAEVMRLVGFTSFGKIAFWYSSVNRLLLLPGWLLLLGCRLPVAGVKLNQHTAAARQGPPSSPAPSRNESMNGSMNGSVGSPVS